MKLSLLDILICPLRQEALKVIAFSHAKDSDEIEEGVLINESRTALYPIIKGVPVMFRDFIPDEFYGRNKERLEKIKKEFNISFQANSKDPDWSFSDEWEMHFEDNLENTWGFTIEERVEQFFLETQTRPESCEGKLILDAGCGNGQLTDALSAYKGQVIGLDYSSSVYFANANKKNNDTQFVRGDLQNPPFRKECFDLIISNGVLHHTKNTFKTFISVSKLVRPDGKFYLWLYRKPIQLKMKLVVGLLDGVRVVTARMPFFFQKLAINLYSSFFYLQRTLKGKSSEQSFEEIRIVAWDALTPLWRHYHNPLEVAHWFNEAGFSFPVLTHWDNPHGFGMFAERKKLSGVPGINFGKKAIKRRFYNI